MASLHPTSMTGINWSVLLLSQYSVLYSASPSPCSSKRHLSPTLAAYLAARCLSRLSRDRYTASASSDYSLSLSVSCYLCCCCLSLQPDIVAKLHITATIR
ncbi:hypothetical protein ARMSODRAFT_516337 [Armillaria solidipes]|uniref:Uncharacterized protein n=1 Tax=Armillaria solidipes TaxID=1076256 RepID=A0A2H3AZC4_9AGAR|nr:hypothetical protein ARMSODRAFT_516337 [Armillaria solidipes]